MQQELFGMVNGYTGGPRLVRFQLVRSPVCTLSAKDLGATKNPAVDLERILVQHFSRILCLDASSAL